MELAGHPFGNYHGTWRRVTDDFRYPDIAQEAGVVTAQGSTPAAGPSHRPSLGFRGSRADLVA